MRILFFIDCLRAGGKERRLIELMKAIKSDPEIDFELAIMNKDIHYKEAFNLGININYLIRGTRKDLSVFAKLYRLCKRYKPDIIHCWDSMTAIYCAPVCRILQIKCVNGMVVDSPGERKILYKPWVRARITFPFSNLIIGNSTAGLEAYNAPRKRSIVIYNGFNFDRIKNIKSGSKIREELNINSELIVGMVAAYSEFKDFPTYFKAAHLVLNNRKNVIFLAIGMNTDSELTRSHIDEKYLSHFRLLGKRSDIESYVNIMDIGVLATYTEGISNSIMEYMALGKPVIATDGGGTNEIIEDQKTGFLVKPSDPVELAEKISILLQDQMLRSEMGKRGEARIHEAFSIGTMTEKYLTACKKLLSN